MNILVTGAGGFVGKNLSCALKNIKDGKDRTRPNLKIDNIYLYDIKGTKQELESYCHDADFVFNLAGVNRPKDKAEFMKGNFGFAETLLDSLEKANNKCPVMLSSSIQAELDNDYGHSKKAGEKLFFDYSERNGVKVFVYRFPNIFGKWCRPNYNSVVATFCYNIACGLPIKINDENTRLRLVYIDDVVNELLDALEGKAHEKDNFCFVPTVHSVTLGEIAASLCEFKDQPRSLVIPEIPENSFKKKLYSTYLSYLPEDKIAFDLNMNCDERGSFTEIMHTLSSGQFSVNISKPGITKGQHWHNSKWEFFIVVHGEALIQEREVGTDQVINIRVSGKKIQAVHMLPGYAHNIVNLSETDELVTLMWANENFDKNHPDTFFEPVE